MIALTHCYLKITQKIIIVISIYFIFGLLFQHAYADEKITTPYQTQHGSVWLLDENGSYIETMQIQTDVDYAITGAIARATIKQQFINSSAFWTEGIYVFPLPEKAAVDKFRMVIGNRIIGGKVKERVQAKQEYERAKLAGEKASLIEQQRPNVFTTSLANIAPGESISIEFEYQQILDYKDEYYRLRFPMVVGPRYHPNNPTERLLLNNDESNENGSNTNIYTETDLTSNAQNPTRIHILLDAGVNLSELKSTYHRININQTSETRYSISTIGENVVANRDFELVWKPQLSDKPQLIAFSQTVADEDYAMITLFPPNLNHLQQKITVREMVFVLDISGSMSGTSIEQAKAALIAALDGLTSIDKFNVIWFNHETDSLFNHSVNVSQQKIIQAKNFINNLQASGGTEMLPALKLALAHQQEYSRFRQVVFVTDGNISNEKELFSVIRQQLGSNRLFTIGIGSAPNAYFMRKASLIGRGTFTYIGDLNEVHEKITSLFKKLETPALINIEIDLDRNQLDIFPNIIPDLYAGETTTLFIKGKNIPQNLSLQGDYGNIEWGHKFSLEKITQEGIRTAWAREKIDSLMSLHHEAVNENEQDTIKSEIIDTALKHHLVSRYTSLIAVDVTPVNLEGLLLKQRIKNNLPHGWKRPMSANGLMFAQTATNSQLKTLLGCLFLLTVFLLYQFYYKEEGS